MKVALDTKVLVYAEGADRAAMRVNALEARTGAGGRAEPARRVFHG